MARETRDVHLVDDGPGCRALQRRVALPIVSAGIHDDALHRGGGVVAFEASSVAAVIPRNNYPASVLIEEKLGSIKAHAACGVERAVNSISVKLPRSHIRHEHMPIIGGSVGRW